VKINLEQATSMLVVVLIPTRLVTKILTFWQSKMVDGRYLKSR